MSGWLDSRRTARRERDELAVLAAVASGSVTGWQLWSRLGRSSGWLYVTLARLEGGDYLTSEWAGGLQPRVYSVTYRGMARIGLDAQERRP